MPVRSLSSFVLRWPNREQVVSSLLEWVKTVIEKRNDVVKIGYFGSYAREDWGVGSDLDLLIILRESELPFERRSVEFDTTPIIVPVDLLLYTEEEFEKMENSGSAFAKKIEREIRWVYP